LPFVALRAILIAMSLRSYSEERAAHCEALAEVAPDVIVAEMFRRLAAEWSAVALLASGDPESDPSAVNPPGKQRNQIIPLLAVQAAIERVLLRTTRASSGARR
jgi:hypothetical protein